MNNVVTLSECCTFIKDGTHGSPVRTPAGIPVLSAAHVRDGCLHFDTDRFTSEEELLTFQKRLKPAPGDVLLTIVGTIGRTAIVDRDRPFVFQRSVCVLRPKKNVVISTYLKSALESDAVKSQFHVEKHEVAQAGIYLEALNEIKIPLPPLSEQGRITTLLDKADRLRRTRRYALELTDTFLPAAFLELFGDPAENPQAFDRVQLEGLFTHSRDGAKCGPFGSALKKDEFVAAGIPVWTMNNVGANEFVEDGCLYITPKKFEELAAYDAQNGDILISRAGTVGRMAIVRTEHPRSIIHTNIIRLSLDNAKILPIYFVALMTWFAPRVARLKRGQEGAYTFMSTGSLGELQIPLPPLLLQQRFAVLVERVECLRAAQREALRQAEHLFASLLHRTFSG